MIVNKVIFNQQRRNGANGMEIVKEIEERFCSKCVHREKCWRPCVTVLAFIYRVDLHSC